MTLLRILALSILLGGCIAFVVWYGWGIGANALALLRARAAASPAPQDLLDEVED
jgi:hypothetical protein